LNIRKKCQEMSEKCSKMEEDGELRDLRSNKRALCTLSLCAVRCRAEWRMAFRFVPQTRWNRRSKFLFKKFHLNAKFCRASVDNSFLKKINKKNRKKSDPVRWSVIYDRQISCYKRLASCSRWLSHLICYFLFNDQVNRLTNHWSTGGILDVQICRSDECRCYWVILQLNSEIIFWKKFQILTKFIRRSLEHKEGVWVPNVGPVVEISGGNLFLCRNRRGPLPPPGAGSPLARDRRRSKWVLPWLGLAIYNWQDWFLLVGSPLGNVKPFIWPLSRRVRKCLWTSADDPLRVYDRFVCALNVTLYGPLTALFTQPPVSFFKEGNQFISTTLGRKWRLIPTELIADKPETLYSNKYQINVYEGERDENK